jgi:predicted acyltransferase
MPPSSPQDETVATTATAADAESEDTILEPVAIAEPIPAPEIVPEPATISPMHTEAVAVAALPATQRLISLDAYRGFVMLLMMAEVLSFKRVSQALPKFTFWIIQGWHVSTNAIFDFLAKHQTHVEWSGYSWDAFLNPSFSFVGSALHDLIQPSFSFIVGVALPFSLATRRAKGQSAVRLTLHAFGRALVLIALGVFLRSVGKGGTNFTFEDTLSQIGLGYGLLFLFAQRPVRDQWIAFALLLVGYWAAFAIYPLPGPDFDYAKVGVTHEWLDQNGFTGFAAHWNKNSNLAWHFDTWFLNLFPREKPYEFNLGGYQTLSFIPTLATMTLGLITGEMLRRDSTAGRKVGWLVLAGVIALALGCALGQSGFAPVVKRIWTPSWVLFSGGWCLLLLALFYTVIDVIRWRSWAFPLVVVGLNSIAAYCIAHLWVSFIRGSLITHFGAGAFRHFGKEYEALFLGAVILFIEWLILFWMYRRKIFLRI